MFAENDLPEHLEDGELLRALSADTAVESHGRKLYQPSLGLLLKIRAGVKRMIKRVLVQCNTPPAFHTEHSLQFALWEGLSAKSAIDLGWSDVESFSRAVAVLSSKNLYLSTELSKELNYHPLLPPAEDGSIAFYAPFVEAVLAYQASLERPEETFEDKDSRDLALAVKEYPREVCPLCSGRRHIYCGSCGGIRLGAAEGLLPARIELPFDILLVVHWHETLHKCTGVHTSVLTTEGTSSNFQWSKTEIPNPDAPGEMMPMWGPMVLSLDAERDVILYPSDDAIPASDFDWTAAPGGGGPGAGGRFRLVVLEATWMFAKGVARAIADYRAKHDLPPLRCVRLENVVGQYWRFHEEGNSALSTIEAIAYTAAAAGLSKENFDKLLTLFRIQKGRVLLAMEQDGWKAPRAVCTSGSGDGDWTRAAAVPLPPAVAEGDSSIVSSRNSQENHESS